jgi:hypothetical protein
MLQATSALFALLTGVAGWHYLFFSRAAARLAGIEEQRLNDRRMRLRRVGGAVMVALAILFYAGFNAVRPFEQPEAFVAIWAGVFLMLALIMVLALIDIRLTWRMRHGPRQRGFPVDKT